MATGAWGGGGLGWGTTVLQILYLATILHAKTPVTASSRIAHILGMVRRYFVVVFGLKISVLHYVQLFPVFLHKFN
jgi:hypothetical protein